MFSLHNVDYRAATTATDLFRSKPLNPQIRARSETCFLRTTARKSSADVRPHTNHGGARRDRTDDLMLAKHALSQLSYGPEGFAPLWGAA